MFLADSSVWIDYFNGRETRATDYLDAALGREPIAVGDLMLAEVLQGFRSERDYRTARQLMLTLDVLPLLGTAIALKSAENFRKLRKSGITVRKTTDCIIATWCIETGTPLLHSDRDFIPFEHHLGLQSALLL
jgi:predicted nucleic acid-binding protein